MSRPEHAPLLNLVRRLLEDRIETVMCEYCGDLLNAQLADAHDCPMLDEDGGLQMRRTWERMTAPPGLARTKGYAVR